MRIIEIFLGSWKRSLATLLLAGLPIAGLAADKPKIVTSIHPLAILVAEVAGDAVTVESLIGAGQSPHTFQMRPSDRRRLANADLIFWVGPALETFLQDLLSQQDLRTKSVALAPTLLPELFTAAEHQTQPTAGTLEADSGAHGEQHAEEHGNHAEHGAAGAHDEAHHTHAGADPHIWLEPGLGKGIATIIAAALKQTGKVDASRIDANLAEFEARLAQTDQRTRTLLSQQADVSYFTYHEAFSLFADHYGLEIAGSLTFSPEIQPGARHMSDVRAKLRNANNPCVLTEPQFSRQWWRSITEGVDLRISTWDPLGTDIVPEPGAYSAFIESLAQAVVACHS